MTAPTVAPPAAIPVGFRVVEISREPIELYKVLKFEGLTGSGGHAKAAVAAGQVKVNGAIEIQKRKKIVSGDTIEFEDHSICIVLRPATEPVDEVKVSDKAETASPGLQKRRKAESKSKPALVVRAIKNEK